MYNKTIVIPVKPKLKQWLKENVLNNPSVKEQVPEFENAIQLLFENSLNTVIITTDNISITKQYDVIIVDEMEIYPQSRKVMVNGKDANLTPKEFDILYFLAKNRGIVFTKEQIYTAVWEEDYLLDDSNIMAFIRKLRKKIEPTPDAPKYILTIWGIGYKFAD